MSSTANPLAVMSWTDAFGQFTSDPAGVLSSVLSGNDLSAGEGFGSQEAAFLKNAFWFGYPLTDAQINTIAHDSTFGAAPGLTDAQNAVNEQFVIGFANEQARQTNAKTFGLPSFNVNLLLIAAVALLILVFLLGRR